MDLTTEYSLEGTTLDIQSRMMRSAGHLSCNSDDLISGSQCLHDLLGIPVSVLVTLSRDLYPEQGETSFLFVCTRSIRYGQLVLHTFKIHVLSCTDLYFEAKVICRQLWLIYYPGRAALLFFASRSKRTFNALV
ncbi:hypothetical protein PISMIDRAFT_680199 [Pisolithus microcarpus 441]|uniref:Uncharacterized protein n=1 Tax=Pisolithus microcarpus 441 TaxID=765257 RepID=A0A0C9Z999_9AGAM|nr:hypothetical protein PISMIDRAFT_680199 [Pisolithus microcarpus 441]